jgi:MFS family permease
MAADAAELGLWNDRRFRLLYSANLLSSLGSTFSPIGTAFGTLDLTHSTSDLGYVLAAGMIPRLVFMPIGGAAADRWSRTSVMVTASVICAAAQIMIVIELLTGTARLGELVALSAVTGAAAAFIMPAMQGVVPSLVPPECLHRANTLIRMANSGSVVLGPALGGVLVAAAGPGWAILVDAVSFVISVPLLLIIRMPRVRGGQASASMLAELQEGWTEFWSRTWVWVIVVHCTALNAAGFMGLFLLGRVAAQDEYGGARAWGLIAAAVGAGYVAGGALAMYVKPRRPLLAEALCAPGLAAPIAALALRAPLWSVMGAGIAAGILLEQAGVAWATTLQQKIPKHLISRVSSYDILGSDLLIPASYLAGGPISAALGLSGAMWLCVAILLASTLPVLLCPDIRRMKRFDHTTARAVDAGLVISDV